eukprot:11491398-Ditylum_brightwellii.AAC.1
MQKQHQMILLLPCHRQNQILSYDNAEAASDNTPPPIPQAEPESVMYIALSPQHSSLSDDNAEAASDDVLSY